MNAIVPPPSLFRGIRIPAITLSFRAAWMRGSGAIPHSFAGQNVVLR